MSHICTQLELNARLASVHGIGGHCHLTMDARCHTHAHSCTTAELYYSTGVLPHRSTIAQLYYCTTAHLYYHTGLLLHSCTTVLLHTCTTAHLYYCTAVQ